MKGLSFFGCQLLAFLSIKFSLVTGIRVCVHTPEQCVACQRPLLRSVSTLVFEYVPLNILQYFIIHASDCYELSAGVRFQGRAVSEAVCNGAISLKYLQAHRH